jgi:hypothetical protein
VKRRLLLSLPVVAVTAVLASGCAGAAVKPHDLTAGTAARGSSSWDSLRPHDVTAGLVVRARVRPNANSWS